MRRKLTLCLLVAPVFAWLLFFTCASRLSTLAASRYSAMILAKGDGKFTNVELFVKTCLAEGAALFTIACLLLLAQRLLAAFSAKRLQPPVKWVVAGWGAFICLNLFIAAAAHTTLFWCALFNGKDRTDNFTQWNIKKGMMQQVQAPRQAVLIGASQVRTQIDTKVLNDRLGRKVWTTELHFPGSTPYDMILTLEQLPLEKVNYVVTYLSEASFYASPVDNRLMYFFGLDDLPGYLKLGRGKPVWDSFATCGILGDIFPLYRAWEPIVARLRKQEVQNAAQHQYDAALDSQLAERAKVLAQGMQMNEVTHFNEDAFVAFARLCREHGIRLIVCCGQLNPIAERALDPALRARMEAFLEKQAALDPNIVLLKDAEMPKQTEADYEDLTHVNLETRARFSEYLAGVLEKVSDAPAKQALPSAP